MNSKSKELIIFSQISKIYGNHEILHNLSLCLTSGRSLAILGPNGAGKTSMIRIILGVVKPSNGIISIFGHPISTSSFESKKKIGVVIEEQTFFLDMSGLDYLNLFGELYEVPDYISRALSLLKYMELYSARNKKLKEYSTGMKKKLNIIQAVLHQPEILILDEPFSGLDPLGISLTLDLLHNMKASGTTLIISSHILSEIDDLVEDLLLIDKGEIKAYGSKEELWERLEGNCTMNLTLLEDNAKGLNVLEKLPEIIGRKDLGELQYIYTIVDNKAFREKISQIIIDYQFMISHLSFTNPSIKIVYEKIMGSNFQ